MKVYLVVAEVRSIGVAVDVFRTREAALDDAWETAEDYADRPNGGYEVEDVTEQSEHLLLLTWGTEDDYVWVEETDLL